MSEAQIGAATQNYSRAIVFMVLAAICFSCMATGAKAASDNVSSGVSVFVRGIIAVVVFGIYMWAKGVPFRCRAPGFVHGRCFFGTLSLHLYFYALARAPLGDVVVLANSAPLFMPLLGLLFLGERPRPLLFVVAGVGFAGVTTLVAPGFSAVSVGMIAAVGTGVASGGAITCLKLATSRDHPLTIIFTFSIWTVATSLPFLVSLEPAAVVPAAPALLFMALAAIGAQVFLTNAHARAPAGVVSVYSYLGVVIAFLIGLCFWGEEPPLRSLVGTGMIIAACVVATRNASRLVDVTGVDEDRAEEPPAVSKCASTSR